MIRMVVFDMAGTVVNEDNVVYKTVVKALENKGHISSLEHVLSSGAGKEKFDAILDILDELYPLENNVDKAEEVFIEFKQMLESAYDNFPIKPQANALEIFSFLKKKGIFVVLNTGYQDETAQQLLRKLNWKEGENFDALINASHVQNSRPAPDMILLAMQKFGIQNPQELVKVGDSGIDIEEGKNANCGYCIGITTGAQTRSQLENAKPNFIIDNLWELTEKLPFQ